ncbi:hypothetical protein ECEC1868_5871, partial [Escherichia coli EC1868]
APAIRIYVFCQSSG